MENKRKLIKEIEFYFGLSILVIIAFYYIYRTIKYSGGFYILSAKNINYSPILILFPMIISLLLLHYNNKNIFYRILAILSSILLVTTIVVCIIIGYSRFKIIEYIILGSLLLISIGLIVLSFANKLFLGVKKYVK